ncbi:MAG TPA: amidase family protein [Polyangiaceae bacterium LLY-WYZ-14_1]|nr:amidase family protein [Polyangiaceae bacterium LLY-WYZ-14_1]
MAGSTSQYVDYDGLGLAELVRRREVRPLDLVDAAIANIERLNPRINAVVARRFEQARQEAQAPLPEGPFLGVPFLVKDLLAQVAGMATGAGSRYFAGVRRDQDSELVRRYRATGVVLLGKTNTPELGIYAQTEPEVHGPCRNPWQLDHTAGGSSGGSGAAVAAGLVPMAHGNDGGGSIRIPASCCGLVGLKPSRGRMPLGPDLAEGWGGLVSEHVLTRSVRDSAAMLDATAGPDAGAPYAAPPPGRPFLEEVGAPPGRVRIAFTTRSLLGAGTHPDCRAAVLEAAQLLEDLGHQVEEDHPPIDRGPLARAYLTLVAVHIADELDRLGPRLVGRAAAPEDVELTTWMLRAVGRSLRAEDYVAARDLGLETGRQLVPFFKRHDLLLTPTLAYPPVRVGELAPTPVERVSMKALAASRARPLLLRALDELGGRALEKTPNTMLFNLTGQPAISLPFSWNGDGLPIGIQLAARPGDEAALLRLAAQLEEARPWQQRRPPLEPA